MPPSRRNASTGNTSFTLVSLRMIDRQSSCLVEGLPRITSTAILSVTNAHAMHMPSMTDTHSTVPRCEVVAEVEHGGLVSASE